LLQALTSTDPVVIFINPANCTWTKSRPIAVATAVSTAHQTGP